MQSVPQPAQSSKPILSDTLLLRDDGPEPVAKNADALDGTVFISDNLPFLKSLDSESIDLVCIDPPFGTKQTFEGTLRKPLTTDERRIESDLMASWGVYDPSTAYEMGIEYPDQQGTTAKFRDIWSFEVQVYEDWWERLRTACPAAFALIKATRLTHSDNIAAYLAFMVERMLEIKRILKPTGNVFVHCDHEANAYLRQMMDAVFGPDCFRNEIVWAFTGPGNPRRWFPRKHQTILFYARSSEAYFDRDAVRVPYSEETMARRGRVEGGRSVISTSAETSGRRSESEVKDRFGGGKVVESWWTDIAPLTNQREATGYPTQKPQSLAERIILATTQPGDLVLDCFAGCAYVPVAAQRNGRRWIACDMSPRAWTVVRRQFHKLPDLGIVTEGEDAVEDMDEVKVRPELANANRVIKIRGPNQLPQRSDGDDDVESPTAPPPTMRFRQRPRETSQTIWEAFVAEWGPRCWYCGSEKEEYRQELHLDHVEANRRDGSNDDCWNRALACTICNSYKSDMHTPEQTISHARQQGRIRTDALEAEILSGFKRRRDWARLRYETEVGPRNTK